VRIAWVTPFSRHSAIGEYGAVIVTELRRRGEVTVFASDLVAGKNGQSWLPDANLRAIPTLSRRQLLEQLDGFDTRIYNLGDYLPFHRTIYELALARPGITILHDVVMHHFFAGYYLDHRRDPTGYVNEVTFAHGIEGRAYAHAVLAGTTGDALLDPLMLRFHMARSAIHRSEGVVVHSEFARQSVSSVADGPVVHIPFPTPRIASAPTCAVRGAESDPHGKVRLLTIGMANPNKMIEEVITTIAASAFLRQRVIYHVMGQFDPDAPYTLRVKQAIEEHGLQGVVFLLGRRSEEDLRHYLVQAALIINLRNPHFGESSWSLLEASFAGKPSVVWKHGYYDEFPDDAVAKVGSLVALRPTLEALCRDGQARNELGQRAQSYARRTFSTARYCERLLKLAEHVHYNRPVLRLADTAADVLLELGQTVTSPATGTVTSEICAFVEDPAATSGLETSKRLGRGRKG